MATSGTYSFLPNRDQIIQAMFRETRGGDADDPKDIQDAAFALNSLVKTLVGTGKAAVNLVSWSTISLTAGISDIALPTGTLWVDRAFIRVGETDYPVIMETRTQLFDDADKQATGQPKHAWFNKQDGKLYLDHVTDTTYTLHYAKVRQYQDFNSDTDDIDFPNNAAVMLKWGLCTEMAYGLPISERTYFEQKFEKARREFIANNADAIGREASTSAMVV